MKLAITFTTLALLSACSNQPKAVDNEARGEAKPTAVASIEAKQVAAEEQAYAVTEIVFKKGSSNLNAESQKKIKDLLKKVEKNQKIDEIKVITWSDEEYPSEDIAELSQGQQILVRQRNSKIRNFIRTQKKEADVEMISMAERPGKLSELWGDSDARLKKSLEDAGIPNTGDAHKSAAKASRSIVMLVVEAAD